MGSGRWSTDVYSAAAGYRAATGTSAFAYSDSGARKAHPALDPMNVGKRESRDSELERDKSRVRELRGADPTRHAEQ